MRETNKLSNQSFTRGGTYDIYRAGDINPNSPLVFFTPNEDDAYYYSLFDDRTDGEFNVYEITYSNPLVISGKSDRERLKEAWRQLHPDKELKDPKDNNIISTEQNARWWMRMDKQNATAMKKLGYDAIVLQDDKTGTIVEVQLLKNGIMKVKDRIKYRREEHGRRK